MDENGEIVSLFAYYNKIAYTRHTDPDKLYYMDWRGTFRDVLVFDGMGKEITDINILGQNFDLEQVAVLTEDGTVFVVNLKDGSQTAILTGINISKFIAFSYDPDQKVRQLAYRDAQGYDWAFNLETGKRFRIS